MACDDLTPGVVARAGAVARTAFPQGKPQDRETTLFHLIRQTLRAQGHATTPLDSKMDVVPKVYNLDFLNSDAPLTEIIDSLKPDAPCRICLYGPPGTGKTCLAHWVARRLGMCMTIKRASDLISPYIGQTEKNLAAAFEQAGREESLLLIDEVDTFLQDRRRAARAWEVSEVNEMLTQMESFQGIFFASTNLVDDLDPASLRRFDLKIRFDFLLPRQIASLLERHCKNLDLGRPSRVLLDEASEISGLTPGDFANVARQHPFRRFKDPAAFLHALGEEVRMKKGGTGRRMGF